MRKHITFTTATVTLALVMMVWANAAVIASHSEHIRPSGGLGPHVMSNSYLLIRALDEVY